MKRLMTGTAARKRLSISEVVQLATRSQMILGGEPRARFVPESPSLWKQSRTHFLWRIAKWPSRLCFPVHIRERESTPDRDSPAFQPDAAADFRRKEASRVRDFQFALAISSVSETRSDIFLGEKREIPQNISVCHSAGQVSQDVVHGDSQSPNAGLAASLVRLYRDDVRVVHVLTLCEKPIPSNYNDE
jgi:hypothetical protein